MQSRSLKTNTAFALLLASIISFPLALVCAHSAMAETGNKDSSLQDDIGEQWRAGLVEGAFLFNTHLNNFAIDVSVDGGTAILTGAVSTKVDKALAEQVALNVDGIKDVKNELEVRSNAQRNAKGELEGTKQALSDAAITTKVKSQLLANEHTSGLDINVETENGTVVLTGRVKSGAEKELAYYIARNTGGVTEIVNAIEVPERKTAGKS